MPSALCTVCDTSVYFFPSLLSPYKPGFDEEVQRAQEEHAPNCAGQKPIYNRAEHPHRYFTGQRGSERMKGPCKICENGARNYLHYSEGRYL